MPVEDSMHRLVEQAQAGDRLALERLLISHSDELSAHIARRMPAFLQNLVGVEDVLQEAFTKAILKIDRIREPTSTAFVAWLKAIGEMTLMDIIKAERRQKRGGDFCRAGQIQDSSTGSLVDLVKKLPGSGQTASQKVARHEATVALQIGIAGLDTDQRRAIQLNLIEGKTLADTAAEMQRTPDAVRGLVHRGKQNLAEAMGRASQWLSQR